MNKTVVISGVIIVLLIIIAIILMKNNNQDQVVNDSNNPIDSAVELALTSTAFTDGNPIPQKFSCDGTNISPALNFSGIPDDAKSLALLVDDPDVPAEVRPEGVFNHWVLFNIDPTITSIGEGQTVGTEGVNGSGELGFTGPCPPTEYEPTEHRYMFNLYALDSMIDLSEGVTKDEVLQAIQGKIISETRLMGTFDRAE